MSPLARAFLLGCASCGAGAMKLHRHPIPAPVVHPEYAALKAIADPATYEAYVSEPAGSPTGPFPLIVYLHAKSQQGGGLEKTLNSPAAGNPIYQLWNKTAPQELGDHFIVAGPHSNGAWESSKIVSFLDFLLSPAAGLDVDRKRVYVMGWAEGGDAALEVAGITPRRFAAVVAASAHPPPSADAYRHFPMWLFHAKNDAVVNYAGVYDFFRGLGRHEGGAPDTDTHHFTLLEEAPSPIGKPGQIGHASGFAAFNTPYLYQWIMGFALA